MNEYTIWQWILFFYIYSIFGWCIETTIVSVKNRKFVNRGFLNGAFLPIYGFGAISVLIVTVGIDNNIVLVYLLGAISATVLEYVAGTIMEAVFRIKYWDYSYRKLQFQGKICLVSTLFWGVLSVFLTYIVHEPIANIVCSFPDVYIYVAVIVIGVLLLIDIYYSARSAFELRATLEKLEVVREELDKLQEQLVKVKENAKEQMNGVKDYIYLQMAEIKENAKEQINETKDKIENIITEKTEKILEKMSSLQSEKEKLTTKEIKKNRRFWRTYTNAKSGWFSASFDEIRENLQKKSQDKKKNKLDR